MPSNQLRTRLLLPVILVVFITIIGTLGYYLLGRPSNATLLDALFMTVITITTIGYGEVIPLNEIGRIFTMFIAITGVGSLFYSLSVFMEHIVSRGILDPKGDSRMQEKIDKLKQHVIIAGLGRVGRQAALELHEAGKSIIIVDPRVESQQYAQEHNYFFLLGDASDDGILEKAGIHRASGLIVTSSSDASNLYIVLSARLLNSNLYIVSRAVDENSVTKLIRAGANQAISPYAIGGRRLAHLILSPTVVDFFDTVLKKGQENLNLEDIKVNQDAWVVGKTLLALNIREKTGASILVVLRGNQVLANPHQDLVLQGGDRLLALGTADQLDRLEAIIADG